jgi:hypothetical protein
MEILRPSFGAPGTSPYVSQEAESGDEIHIVVVDEDGLISGTQNTVLEVYSNLSKASDAKTPQGDTNYYPEYCTINHNMFTGWIIMQAGSNWGTAAAGITLQQLQHQQ